MRPLHTASSLVALSCLLGSLGCSSDGSSSKSGPDDPNPEPVAKETFDVEVEGAIVTAGTDVEYCQVAEFPGNPGETYYVNRLEMTKAPYSHHLFVNVVTPGSAADTAATDLGVGNRVPCVSASTTFGDGVITVGGAAKEKTDVSFPDGIGQVYTGGQKMIFDYHYFNTSDGDVTAEVGAKFFTVDQDHVKKLARGYSVMHVGFSIPPLGKGEATAQCTFNHDVLVAGIQRHTHRLGTDYKVWSVDAEDNPTDLWESHDWAEDIDHPFAEPVLVHAGEGYRYHCEYQNTENRTITFGTKATDEMCNLFGTWWVVNEDDEVGPQSCVVFKADADGVARGVAGSALGAPITG